MTMSVLNERKTVVPWFSMSEWDITYKSVYSGKAELQLLAYDRMLVWKARCPRLPIGVECTMGMLHVYLKDLELASKITNGFMQPTQEYDLRLLYSTSVMRFLNQIAVLTQSSTETLYHAARKMYVPDWLVGLRHEIAHGANVPPLPLLRKATHFALNWLHEYYWKGEAAASADFVAASPEAGTDEVGEEIRELFEIWEALKLYMLSGYNTLENIPDGALRVHIKQTIYNRGQATDTTDTEMQYNENEDENLPNEENQQKDDENVQNDGQNIQNDGQNIQNDDQNIQNDDQNIENDVENVQNNDGNLQNDDENLQNGENLQNDENQSDDDNLLDNGNTTNASDEIDLLPLTVISVHVKQKLMFTVRKYRKSYEICNQITESILSGQLFIPSLGIWHFFGRESEGVEDEVPPLLLAIWSPMINSLIQFVNILPTFIRRLSVKVIEMQDLSAHQHWVAALWMKELFASFLKTLRIHKYLYSDFGLPHGSRLPRQLWMRAEKLVSKDKPELRASMSLKIARFPEPFISLGDIKKLLLSPSRWTNLYLPRVLEYFRLSAQKAQHILQLLDIYTRSQNVYEIDTEKDSEEEQVHTVEELMTQLPFKLPLPGGAKENQMLQEKNEDKSLWETCEGHNWVKCPLGVLPWQTDKNLLDLDFDTSVTWKSTKEQSNQLPKEFVVSELPNEISWAKILKKRIKKGRVIKQRKKMKNILKKTVHVLFNIE